MKVKILTTFPKCTFEFDKVWFGSDLHLNHEAVIRFGRNFSNVEEMNETIIKNINNKVSKNDLIVLLGDTMMGDKDYEQFLDSLICKNIIILLGNHCNLGKLEKISEKLLYIGYYIEFNIEKQIICCSHYPMFNWNYQDDGSFHLHGHLHSDENPILKQIHEYKSMDVGIDNYYKLFGEYNIFNFDEIKNLLKDKKMIGRHEK